MRRLGPEQKIRVEINDGFGSTGAVDTDWNSGVGSFAQVAIHPQCHLNVCFLGEKDLTHWYRLQWFLRYLAQNCRGIEADFRALGRSVASTRRQTVVAEDVVHGSLEIGVAKPLDNDSVDVRDLPVHRVCAIDAYDRPDSDGRIDRRPEMEFVGSIGLPFRRNDAAKGFAHEIALKNSSTSRIP